MCDVCAATPRGNRTGGATMRLDVIFLQTNGNFYARARHNGIVVDTTPLPNVWEHTAAYIENVMTWGYNRGEIHFVILPNCGEDVSESIARDIAIYADNEL